jgi:mpaB/rubber oxygenase-like protein
MPGAEVLEAFVADMWRGDPLAERFVAEVLDGPGGRRKGRKLLDLALEGGLAAVPDAPASMRTLFAEFETVPEWVDPGLVEQGAAIWRRWGTDLFAVAGAETLEMYTESAVALPLSLAGGYAGEAALRRFLETTRFWIDVSEPGALLRIGSAGRATAMRVRVMHVGVRQRVSSHAEWSAERWGVPISQAWATMTLMGGSIVPAMLMWPLGYQTSASEIRALLHYQRFLGHLLGVQPTWYPSSVRESIQLTFLASAGRTYTAGEHGAELIESFPRAFAPRLDADAGVVARARASYHHRLICAYTAMCMAPGTRRRYDLPPMLPWVLLPAARFPLVAAGEVARRVVPGFDEFADRRARRRREAWYAEQMAGREAAFEAASSLRR